MTLDSLYRQLTGITVFFFFLSVLRWNAECMVFDGAQATDGFYCLTVHVLKAN